MEDLEKRARELVEEENQNATNDSETSTDDKNTVETGQSKSLVTTNSTFQEKSLSEVNFNDVKFKLDTSKDFQEQVEDVLGGVVTASAVQDKDVQETLKKEKSEELVNKAHEKASKAKEQAINAETEVQKAERALYESVLNTFGIFKHLPRYLMKLLVWILSPLYVVLTLLIGLPCGFVKVLIDNLDGIICRYEDTKEGTKPKIKVIFWILFAALVVGAICLTVLKCLNKI